MSILIRALARDLDMPELTGRRLAAYTVGAIFWLILAGVLYVAAYVLWSPA